ncbi:hypothetical protein [Nocardioides sp.]|uniref:hypothetical protein n=2 Tax=Nocardioides sp. TaxID=35761 RepID=UPI00321B227E
MTGSSTVVGASMLAHGLHAAMVLLGLWGLGALLLPQFLERRAVRGGTTYAAPRLDEHDRRVAELRAAAASGSLALAQTGRATSAAPTTRSTPRTPVLGLPLALVSGTAAAGIHAAVAPPHLSEEPLFGVFFLLVAGAQLTWVATLASSTTPRLLRVGIGLNAALILLWLLTRTLGLPLGLLPEAHPVGGWDVACVLWQLATIACCARLLRRPSTRTSTSLPGWFEWHPSTRAAVGAAAVVLVLLTVVGAHS